MSVISQGFGFSIAQLTCRPTPPTSTPISPDCVVGPQLSVTESNPPDKSVYLNWTLKPKSLDAGMFTFEVQRSGSPWFRGAEHEQLTEGRLGITSYEDMDVDLEDHFREYYYRVIARSVENPAIELVSAVARMKSRPSEQDLILQEIRYRHSVLMRYVGTPAAIFLSKTYGQRCHVCYDEVLMRVSEGRCTACFRTTFLGGYYMPIPARVQFAPAGKRPGLEVFGKEHRTFVSAILGHDPILKPGDLIKDLQTGTAWDVASVEPPTTKLGSIGHQTAILYRLDRSDIEYELVSDLVTGERCPTEWRSVLG